MDPSRLPRLRLPQTDRPNTWSVLGSFAFHALLVAMIVWVQTRPPEESLIQRPGVPGAPGGGGEIRYIQLDAAPAVPSPQVVAEAVPPPVVPPPVVFSLPTRKLEVPLPQPRVTLAGPERPGSAPGAGGGAGGGTGGGVGRDTGVGIGGEGGDTFPPQMKYTILPPLPAPASLRGRTLDIHFWVKADGRVANFRVQPEIKDAGYRTQLYALLREYVFEPARKLDGTRVPGEAKVTITL